MLGESCTPACFNAVMTASSWRWSDARFLLILLLPGLTLISLGQHPGNMFWGGATIWAVIAVVDTWWPGAQRSPPPVGPQPWLPWLLRLYVPLQLALLVAGLAAAPHTTICRTMCKQSLTLSETRSRLQKRDVTRMRQLFLKRRCFS